MTRFQKKATAYIAAVLAAAICMSGCQEYEDNSQPVKAGQTISSDSKWINSDIDGAIDEKTETDIKDDFYTAVNSEWILKTKLGDDDLSVSGFSGCESVLEKRELDILRKSRDDIVDTLDSDVIDPALLTHDRELVSDFTRLSADWNDRNDAGIDPAKPYIDAIEKIASLDEMSDYLLNKDGTNFTLDYFIPFGVMSPLQNGDTNTVFISTCRSLSLMDHRTSTVIYLQMGDSINHVVIKRQSMFLKSSGTALIRLIRYCADATGSRQGWLKAQSRTASRIISST
jgi:hypothetical protein